VTGPAEGAFGWYVEVPGWYGVGYPEESIPPEGAVPSTPEEGELVAQFDQGPFGDNFVFVYADGRVISWVHPDAGTRHFGPNPGAAFSERRLTPEGVELLRSGAVKAEDLLFSSDAIPADAWEDPEIKPFVPSRYVVHHSLESGSADYDVDEGGCLDPSAVVGLFPEPVRALIRESSRGQVSADSYCYEVTTDDARTLVVVAGANDRPVEDSTGGEIWTYIRMLLPHGEGAPCTHCG
jgi:hypothetical protein